MSDAALPQPTNPTVPALAAAEAEREVEELAERYLARLQAGEVPDRPALVRAHPHLGDRLERRLELVEALFRLAGQPAAPSAPEETGSPFPSLPPQATIRYADAGSAPVAPSGPVRAFDYEVLGELGRGGKGIVYKARQCSLNRLVALKVIRPGASARLEERVRFRIEAEAVAALQHPHIVQIYEIGEQAGIPCLAMELVEGGSLEQVLAGQPQPARESAELVEKLARAMHHAHQRGIVHRDLKPSNVLLQKEEGGRGTEEPPERSSGSSCILPPSCFIPKITDFGLAKRWQEGESGPTQTVGIVGTPCYMAPEQAQGCGKPITPATDVYALGGILYEMLTGRPPFLAETPLATLRQVLHEEVVPPSRLRKRVPRDLETICLKCLHKDPRKRYATAGDLAEDLRRFLAGEPITARPVPAWERLAKWARRRPASATLCLALAAGVAMVLWYNHLLSRERDRAEASVGKMLEAVNDMLTDVAEEELVHAPHMEEKRRALLTRAYRIFKDFLERHGDDPRLRGETALAAKRLGDVLRLLGEYGQAEEAYREGIDLIGRLPEEQRSRPEFRHALAECYNFLGEVLRLTGRAQEVQQAYTEALALQERLTAEYPEEPAYQRDRARILYNLGILLRQTGRPAEARKPLSESIALLKQLPETPANQQYLARAHLNLGTVFWDTRDHKQANRHFGEAITVLTDLAGQFTDVPDYRHDLAVAHNNRGNVFGELACYAEARQEHEEARDLFLQLTRNFPRVPAYRLELANTRNSLGRVLLGLQDLSRARQELEEARQLLKELSRLRSTSAAYPGHLGQVIGNLGLVDYFQGQREQARQSFAEAAGLLREALKRTPDQPDFRNALRSQYQSLAETHLQLQDHRQARAAALALAGVSPENPRDHYFAACFLARCAAAAQNDPALSQAARRKARREYVADALEHLRQAQATGFQDRDWLKRDEATIFAALREEDDFLRLRAEILARPDR